MSVDRKELMNEAFDSFLVTVGVVGISMASKKLLGEKLTSVDSVKDTVKLGVAVAASTILVKYCQSKKWIPEDPFKKT